MFHGYIADTKNLLVKGKRIVIDIHERMNKRVRELVPMREKERESIGEKMEVSEGV